MERSLNLSNLKASFGRHETFALRYSWLTKGFQTFTKNPEIFSSDEATIDLGVGKNRVNAIKYWLRATSMLDDTAVINSGLSLIIGVVDCDPIDFTASFSNTIFGPRKTI